jgi:hypothetical protein
MLPKKQNKKLDRVGFLKLKLFEFKFLTGQFYQIVIFFF